MDWYVLVSCFCLPLISLRFTFMPNEPRINGLLQLKMVVVAGVELLTPAEILGSPSAFLSWCQALGSASRHILEWQRSGVYVVGCEAFLLDQRGWFAGDRVDSWTMLHVLSSAGEIYLFVLEL